MKTKQIYSLFALLLILTPIQSWSADDSYESLETTFDEVASAPTFSEVVGWWSGRCYHKNKPKTPLAFLLIASDDGVKHLAIAGRFDENEPADLYDNLSDADREIFKMYMKSEEYLASEISERDDTIFSNIFLGVHNVKKLGSNYVALMRHSQDFDYNYNCIFLKKVSN